MLPMMTVVSPDINPAMYWKRRLYLLCRNRCAKRSRGWQGDPDRASGSADDDRSNGTGTGVQTLKTLLFEEKDHAIANWEDVPLRTIDLAERIRTERPTQSKYEGIMAGSWRMCRMEKSRWSSS